MEPSATTADHPGHSSQRCRCGPLTWHPGVATRSGALAALGKPCAATGHLQVSLLRHLHPERLFCALRTRLRNTGAVLPGDRHAALCSGVWSPPPSHPVLWTSLGGSSFAPLLHPHPDEGLGWSHPLCDPSPTFLEAQSTTKGRAHHPSWSLVPCLPPWHQRLPWTPAAGSPPGPDLLSLTAPPRSALRGQVTVLRAPARLCRRSPDGWASPLAGQVCQAMLTPPGGRNNRSLNCFCSVI